MQHMQQTICRTLMAIPEGEVCLRICIQLTTQSRVLYANTSYHQHIHHMDIHVVEFINNPPKTVPAAQITDRLQ
jgi:hypothetical protein